MFVRLDHVASRIVNADYGIMRAAVVLSVFDRVPDFQGPQTAEWHSVGDQIKAARNTDY